jgi:hypothetical protein
MIMGDDGMKNEIKQEKLLQEKVSCAHHPQN